MNLFYMPSLNRCGAAVEKHKWTAKSVYKPVVCIVSAFLGLIAGLDQVVPAMDYTSIVIDGNMCSCPRGVSAQ